MTVSTTRSTVSELLRSYAEGPAEGLEAIYRALVDALWQNGRPTSLAVDGTPLVVAAFDRVAPARLPRLAVLLGLLTENEYPAEDGEITALVRSGLDRYLDLLKSSPGGLHPVTLSLLYLVSHFPADRERILQATAELPLEVEERTRLIRSLADLDPAAPDLGRSWPAPSMWQLDSEDEGHFADALKHLTTEQIRQNWENDTRTVWAFSGAIAYWAARNGKPAPVTVREPAAWDPAQQPPNPPTDATFGDRADALACPTCRGKVNTTPTGAKCEKCGTTYLSAMGILDLSAGVREGQPIHEATNDLLQNLSETPRMGVYYESLLRPAYLRMSGDNFGNVVTKAVEDAYVLEHLAGTEGLVVDLAAGAGTWTAVVREAVGADRMIAVDMLLPMLVVLRDRLPDVPTVRASALNLPFADGTVGAVNLWNALQAFPDDAAQALAEVGRVLRPGGVLTMMTYRWNEDPVARHFQAAHFFPSRPDGHLLFELDELHQWLAEAGLTVRDEVLDKGSFVFVTAERTA